LPTTTSGELKKLHMLMQRKHWLDRLLTLKASGGHDLMGSFTAHPVEEMPGGVVQLWTPSLTGVWSEYGRSYSICLKV
jgi:hypothetical protein